MENRREHILSSVKKTVQTIDPQAEVILFGSHARGDARPDSDWDFLILTARPVDRVLKNQIRDAVFEVELALGAVISLVISSKKEKEKYATIPLYQNIDREGILL